MCSDPILFQLGVPIHTYGVLLALAFVAAIGWGVWRGHRVDLDRGVVLDVALVVVLGALVGARLLYIWLYPDQFRAWTDWFAIHRGGMVFFGGLLGASAATVAWMVRYRLPLRDVADLAAPCVAIGHAIGRLGCLVHGCCYGAPTDLPWGFALPALGDGVARHPVQLYEAFFLAGLAVLTDRQLTRRPFRGAIWGIYLVVYGAFRFTIEFWRADDRGGVFTPWSLSISQAIGVVLVTVGLGWLARCRRLAIGFPMTDGRPDEPGAGKGAVG